MADRETLARVIDGILEIEPEIRECAEQGEEVMVIPDRKAWVGRMIHELYEARGVPHDQRLLHPLLRKRRGWRRIFPGKRVYALGVPPEFAEQVSKLAKGEFANIQL